jgi:hypothetical protein
LRVLDDPAAYAPLGRAGAELVREKYSLDVSYPRFLKLCEEAIALPRVGT